MKNFELYILLFLFISIGLYTLNQDYLSMKARDYDPIILEMSFQPRAICPYDPVYALAYYGYVFPYHFPLPVIYRAELDIEAKRPYSVTFHELPPKLFSGGSPKLLDVSRVWYYESPILFKIGVGELWISYNTTGYSFYMTYKGAVGDVVPPYYLKDVSSFFVLDPGFC